MRALPSQEQQNALLTSQSCGSAAFLKTRKLNNRFYGRDGSTGLFRRDLFPARAMSPSIDLASFTTWGHQSGVDCGAIES